MGWFDILKLGGVDFGTPEINQESHYDDRLRSQREKFFHNLEDVATTRPHFEYQVKNKYSDIQGNLREIAQMLRGKMSKMTPNIEYMAFSDRNNSKYVVSFRRIEPDKNYTGSIRPSKFKKPTTPKNLENTVSMILFDSVYQTSDVGRLRQVFSPTGSPILERLIRIWGKEYDKKRLREIMENKKEADANKQELLAERKELSNKRTELQEKRNKLYEKNKNRKITRQQKDKNFNSIDEINTQLKKIESRLEYIDTYTSRSKGKTKDPPPRGPPRKGRGRKGPPNPFGGPT